MSQFFRKNENDEVPTPLEQEMRLFALESTFEELRVLVQDLFAEIRDLSEQVKSQRSRSNTPLTQVMIDSAVSARREGRFDEVAQRMETIAARMGAIAAERKQKK